MSLTFTWTNSGGSTIPDLNFVTNLPTVIDHYAGQELWQYQPPEVLPDLFDDLGTDKPQEDDDNIDIYYETEGKDTNLNTPNMYQSAEPFSSDGTDLITAEELDWRVWCVDQEGCEECVQTVACSYSAGLIIIAPDFDWNGRCVVWKDGRNVCSQNDSPCTVLVKASVPASGVG